jgi:ketosteroid isomerase-like protein
MKTLLVVALLGLTISFALPVFAQDKGAVDPKIEQQIRAFNEEWDKAFNRNDATAMGTFYTDDAVIISPNEGTFTGRKEIVERKLKALDFDEDHCSNMVTTITQLTMEGNEIHEIGEWSCT